MGILKKVTARNFKCFRQDTEVDLRQGTYLIGANNSGKTAVLQAINCFFNSEAYSPGMLNRTELTRRQAGYNRSDISVEFDLTQVTGRVRHERMIRKFGESLELTKSFTWREQSETIAVTYTLLDHIFEFDRLDDDVIHLLNSVAVSYIHPQEGPELLRKAQEKFKKRLFHNWGRHASVSERLTDAQEKWENLRATANSYLSRALTDRIRSFWPGSEIKIDLPERLEEFVAISDISFRGAANLPEVTLTDHGTGAQSSVLYQTHFILDSDRSLHQGMYFPIWLLEEPESFLHADIAFQLGRQLASNEWQDHIQMLISTHSPIILAGSHQNPVSNRWVVFDRHAPSAQIAVEDVTEENISSVGRLMGDPNFEIYFSSASVGNVVLLEDARTVTKTAIEAAGVPVTKALGGISEVKKYLHVYLGVNEAVGTPTYFIVDGDVGLRDIQQILAAGTVASEVDGWKKHQLLDSLFVVVSPEGTAIEDLFDEWDEVLEETVDDLFEADMTLKTNIPTRLSRAVDRFRRDPPADRDAAKLALRPMQDAKDRFWERADAGNWQISAIHANALHQMIF